MSFEEEFVNAAGDAPDSYQIWVQTMTKKLEEAAKEYSWELTCNGESSSTKSVYFLVLPRRGLCFRVRLSDHSHGPAFMDGGDKYSLLTEHGFELPKELLEHLKADPLAFADKEEMLYHFSTCPFAREIVARNLVKYASEWDAERQGYMPCRHCNPPTSN